MYYPKNQIETNLYSNGDLVIESTKRPYYGFYFSTYDKKYFSGKEPNDGPNLPLTFPSTPPSSGANSLYYDTSTQNPIAEDYRFTIDNRTYSIITNQPKVIDIYTPVSYYPILTDTQKANGEFIRYIIKKSNENIYCEVNQNNFQRAMSDRKYQTITLNWIIKGPINTVIKQNLKQVKTIEIKGKVQGLGKFLNYNFLEFYQG